MARKSKSNSVNVEDIQHKDKRANIPTEELRDFVSEEESTPKIRRYPRDPGLDPQLVWRGKDDLDERDLQVSVVPIYIQEKIHPQVIIKNVAEIDRESTSNTDGQLDLFARFNGGPEDFDKKVEFYKHQQNWTNRLILGDCLQVMASLAEKEGLRQKVQMVFFDPPYGISFSSNWQVSTRKLDVKDRVEDASRQPEQVLAFRDTWKDGIHSYLTYLRDRLVVARDLLTETGSIFVQIGEANVHVVRCLLDEVFGPENFISIIPFRKKTMPFGTNFIEQMADFLIWYGKQKKGPDGKAVTKYRALRRPANVEGEFHHCWYELPDGSRHRMTPKQIDNHALLPEGARVYRLKSLEPSGLMESGMFDYTFEGRVYKHPANGYGTKEPGMDRLKLLRRLQPEGNRLTFIMYADENPAAALTAPWFDTVGADDKQYVVQTNTEVIKRCILMTTDPGDLVLDPTCGSGTTATVAEQWGRRWITCDTSRVALAVARTRLMSAKFSYYLLADSLDGRKKEAEVTGISRNEGEPNNDIRKGFVYRRDPHITMKSLANNPDIKENMSPEQLKAAITRHIEWETRYDQPYEDKKRVRVCGPFSVESLSPHRVLSIVDENNDGVISEEEARKTQHYVEVILENLTKSGVQNRTKGERLSFESLKPYAGLWIQAIGEYLDSDGKLQRAAVSIGPERGTVGAKHIKEAAKESVQGVGFKTLIVCGFAFDPYVGEECKKFGDLMILPTKMNPDLSMSGELLKKTGQGNLFMTFGEPDIDLRTLKDGMLVAEIKGVDVYDPNTGQVRSSSPDEIACWLIDSDYDGESFFVRQAYFTSADEPYESLKRALKAEIDPAAWQQIYSKVSRPFQCGQSGKIAIKVINHYGDEVMKVFSTISS